MTPAKTAVRVDAPPTLVAKIDGRTVPMNVRSLAIDVSIAGFASLTTMEITFENPHDRDLEGEILFPLPEGAALCGYGLDVDGVVVDASLVAKPRARQIFEEEVRKGIDPGLMEHVGGNLFRTRIYPVPANGCRTVRVTHAAALASSGGNAVYELPLRFEPPQRDVSNDQAAGFPAWSEFFGTAAAMPGKREGFHLRVAVGKGDVTPEAGDLGFTDAGDCWVAESSRIDTVPDLVRVVLPAVPARHCSVERGEGGGHWFRIDDLVEEPPLIEGREAAAPARVGIVWDASLSRATTDKGPDFTVLRELLGRWGSLTVHLRVLRDRVEDAGTFTIVAGEADALLERLRDLPCDGGTGPIPPLGRDCDLHLLFSDGLVTFGSAETPEPERPVYAFCAAPVADRAALRRLAEGSGGALFDPAVTPVEEIADSVVGEAFRFLGVDGEAGEVTEVFPARPRPAPPGRFGVVGRLLSESAEITLLYGRGGRVTDRRTYRLSRRGASTRGVVTRLWAQAKADELAASPERHAEALLDLGRRFGIVTPNTSLLVLETLSQHLEHDVEPAPSRGQLHEEWRRHRRKTEEDEAERAERKLHEVEAAWRRRVEWWETEFEPEPPPVEEEEKHATEEESFGSERRMAGLSAPEPMMSSLGEEEDGAMYDMACAPPPPEGAAGPEDGPGPSGGIAVKSWDPDTPWLRALKKAGDDGAYEAYLSVREKHARSPSFYLDCATHLYRIGRPEHARRVLSNVLELSLDSPALLRVCAYLLATQGEAGPAVEILEQVLRMRPDEPQSHRDLALVLEESEEWRRAAELLWRVVTGDWDDRFPGIETIALMELNRLLERARRAGAPVDPAEVGIEPRFLRLLHVDLRVVLAWDADLTDVDLWVTEPSGEKCYYGNNLTQWGGRMSNDLTQGYGPEEYLIHRAIPGSYAVQANYYGSGQQSLLGPATILATIFRNYGREDEERRVVTIRVDEVKDVVDVAEVLIK